MKLIPLPAFTDNYLWLLHDEKEALVVDPGEATPVVSALQDERISLRGILVTHHHSDHVGGIDTLRQATQAAVWGPARERIPSPYTPLQDGDLVDLLGLQFRVMDAPGHTAGHIAYYCDDMDGTPLLFCGDTLFSGGCGRLFEGTPAQMLASLQSLAALPDHTRVCCTHEYTLANLKFALEVDPGNAALKTYYAQCVAQRAQGLPTLPSTIGLERQVNPFLRSDQAAIVASVRRFDPAGVEQHGVFATLRQWKNQYQ